MRNRIGGYEGYANLRLPTELQKPKLKPPPKEKKPPPCPECGFPTDDPEGGPCYACELEEEWTE